MVGRRDIKRSVQQRAGICPCDIFNNNSAHWLLLEKKNMKIYLLQCDSNTSHFVMVFKRNNCFGNNVQFNPAISISCWRKIKFPWIYPCVFSYLLSAISNSVISNSLQYQTHHSFPTLTFSFLFLFNIFSFPLLFFVYYYLINDLIFFFLFNFFSVIRSVIRSGRWSSPWSDLWSGLWSSPVQSRFINAG